MKKVLMWSSGLDSTIAWFYLGKPKTVFVNLGHKYHAQEYFTCKALAKRLKMDFTLDKRLYMGDHEAPDAYIPMRNLFLAMIGALYGDVVYMVFQKGEQSIPDRSPKFLQEASEFLSFLNGRKINVQSPFMDYTKADMVKWFLTKGLPLDVLYKTFSCFAKDIFESPCGECPACFRRWIAFEYNNLPLILKRDIKEWSGIPEYVKKIKAGEYEAKRANQMVDVLRRHKLWK